MKKFGGLTDLIILLPYKLGYRRSVAHPREITIQKNHPAHLVQSGHYYYIDYDRLTNLLSA